MKIRKRLALLLLSLTFGQTVVALDAKTVTTGKNNEAITTSLADERFFVFRIPPDMKKVAVQGIDSFVGRYKSDSLELNFDYGLYSDPLKFSQKPDNFNEWSEKINGYRCKMVSYSKSDSSERITAVHFPRAGNVKKGENKLTVYCTCQNEEACVQAQEIFRSITFKE